MVTSIIATFFALIIMFVNMNTMSRNHRKNSKKQFKYQKKILMIFFFKCILQILLVMFWPERK